ncbi:MAG TPA: hypothetical protein VFU95_09100, partial [Telluria sp.]|nr:hypothetical protein [Telluria sp.]
YRGLMAPGAAPFAEDDLKLMAQPIDTRYPWHDPSLATQSYVAGKLQAEAYLYREGSLPVVTARLAHVLGGPEDFTGRLAHYVEMVRQGVPLRYSDEQAAASFMRAQDAASFLVWAGEQDFRGPLNAAAAGPLSAHGLHHRVAQALDADPRARRVAAAQPGELSPFDYPAPLVLDTSRAAKLGYRFGHTDDWLDNVIRQHDLAYV